jgi:hypothetical protein
MPPQPPLTLAKTSQPSYAFGLRQIKQVPKPLKQRSLIHPEIGPEKSIRPSPPFSKHALQTLPPAQKKKLIKRDSV